MLSGDVLRCGWARGPDVGDPDPDLHAVAKSLAEGPRVAALPHRMSQDISRAHLPTISLNLMLPFARWGIDPFNDRFEVTLHTDGTIRGTGAACRCGLIAARPRCSASMSPVTWRRGACCRRDLWRRGAEPGVGIAIGPLGGGAAPRPFARLGSRSESLLPIGEAGLRCR